ncbi:MAG: hypothetical protein ACKOE6_16770 [Flammeovirgaceae bacterium]
MVKKDPIRTLFVILQLGIVLGLLLNSTLFRHSHLLQTGEVIDHAHAYHSTGEGPFESHSHSENEWWILELITDGVFDFGMVTAAPTSPLAIDIAPFFQSTSRDHLRNFDGTSNFLRGPPLV